MARVAPIIAILAAAGLAPVHALEGNRFIGVGPVQLGQGGAGVASAQDSTWMGLNPATLHGLGSRVDVSLYALYAKDHIEPEGFFANAAAGRMEDEATALSPQLSGTRAWGPGTFAAGIYGVGGLELEWPEPRGGVPDWDRRVEARITRASVAYAYPLPSDWTLGLALNLNYQTFESDAMTGTGAQTTGAGASDDAFGGGFILGVQKRFDTVELGLAYHSRQWMERFDKYGDLLIGSLDQPQMLQVGVSWQLHERIALLLDYRFLDWDGVDLYGDEDQGFGWEDQHIVKLAINGTARENLTLRAGISWGNSPIEEDDVFVNGLTPLITELHICVGATWRISERAELQFAYVHAFENELTDDGGDVGGGGEGTTIDVTVHGVALGLGWIF